MVLYITEKKSGKKRKAENYSCENCSQKFLRRINENPKRRFCCSKCYYSSVRKQRIEVCCSNCQKGFKLPFSRLKNSKHGVHFCSRQCKDFAQSLKGNCAMIRPSHYGTSQGREVYKNLIKNTANPCCVGCKESRPYLLCVHHIDGNHANNLQTNLEIVCRNCHGLRHLKKDSAGNWVRDFHSLTPRDELGGLV